MSASESSSPSNPAAGPLWRETARSFPLVFLPLLGVSLLIVGAVYWHQSSTDARILRINQREHVKLQGEIIAADFRSVAADLMILAESRTLAGLLHGGLPQEDLSQRSNAERRADLADEFHAFLTHKSIYDQVRLIDAGGMEIVRVNFRDGRPFVVPDDALQNKKDRYYFGDTWKLAQGEVFVSPLDLNVEDGQVERPLKPTIRFATPVFDAAGRKRGIVVLNYLGARLIDKLRLYAQNDVGETWLLNSDGYWLAGPSPEVEWGFMFPERGALSLADRAPATWKQIVAAETGQFGDAGGLYTFRTVYPMRDVAATADAAARRRAVEEPYFWKLVSHVPPPALSAAGNRLGWGLWAGCGGLAVVLAIVAWFIARLRVEHRAAQRQLLDSERLAAVGEAMTGLAHECRNALQRSRAGLEMLEKRVASDADARELLGEVQQAQTYLADLYEEARGYAAPVNLKREATDLRQLVEQVWSQVCRNGADAPPLEVEAESDPVCNVDPRALGQVLRNVFENALAAAAHPRVRVHFAEGRLAGRAALRVAIWDNGPGISSAERARMFEPFYTTKAHGTGLGLAISRRLVEAHGGTVEAAAANGPGAEIIIHLPRIAP